MIPGDTAFTLTPRLAKSIARQRVTAASPPLVRAAIAAGTTASGWSTRLVVMLTM